MWTPRDMHLCVPMLCTYRCVGKEVSKHWNQGNYENLGAAKHSSGALRRCFLRNMASLAQKSVAQNALTQLWKWLNNILWLRTYLSLYRYIFAYICSYIRRILSISAKTLYRRLWNYSGERKWVKCSGPITQRNPSHSGVPQTTGSLPNALQNERRAKFGAQIFMNIHIAIKINRNN